jgi:serine/threonine-protein kinase RsbT
LKLESFMSIESEGDIYVALSCIRHLIDAQFSSMDKQKILVSTSELLRNVLDHAGAQGHFACSILHDDSRIGLCVRVSDNGPGIAGMGTIIREKPIKKSSGLGVGLSGVKRLMDEVDVKTSCKGTTIMAVKWAKAREQTLIEQ